MNYYERLKPSELQQLEKDFINFLVLNGITGDDWEKMKNTDPKAAEGMVDQYSEVVFEASMRKAQFLLMVDPHNVRSFHCQTEKIVMVSLSYTGDEAFNFHEVDDLQEVLVKKNNNLEIVSADKAYAKKREYELYDMIKSGCKISDGKAYKLLSLYWAELRSTLN